MPKTKTSRSGSVNIVAHASAGKLASGKITVRNSAGKETANSFWDSPAKVKKAARVQVGDGGVKKAKAKASKAAAKKGRGAVASKVTAKVTAKKSKK